MPYFPGSSVKMTATFTIDGVPTDPTTITLKILDPSGNTDTFTYSGTVTKASTGVFFRNVDLDEEGFWKWRWVGTGSVQAANEGTLVVEQSPFV